MADTSVAACQRLCADFGVTRPGLRGNPVDVVECGRSQTAIHLASVLPPEKSVVASASARLCHRRPMPVDWNRTAPPDDGFDREAHEVVDDTVGSKGRNFLRVPQDGQTHEQDVDARLHGALATGIDPSAIAREHCTGTLHGSRSKQGMAW